MSSGSMPKGGWFAEVNGVLKRSQSYFWGLGSFLVIAIGLIVDESLFQKSIIKPQIDLFGIVGIPLFIITTVELIRTHRLQRGELVRSHVSSFLINKELTSAFYDLVYNFDTALWNEVNEALLAEGLDPSVEAPDDKLLVLATDAERVRYNRALERLNEKRPNGSKLFHPKFFQGSLEEQRFDAMLNYFDIVAYNFSNKLIDIEDVDGVSAYYLTVIGTREVFRTYQLLLENGWPSLDYHRKTGAPPPYRNLSKLLKALKDYNQKRYASNIV